MDFSILFIKILSVYFVVSGLLLLMKGKTFAFVLKDFFKHPAMVYMTGLFLVLFGGGVLISSHGSVDESTVMTLTKVFAWLVFLKGLMYLYTPKALSKLASRKLSSWFGVLGLVMLVLGVYLYFSF